MKIRKGDKVKVTTGKYKNTIGAVLQVLTKKDRVVVENVNVKKRAVKKSETNNENYIYFPHSIHISNVRVVDDEGKYVKKGKVEAVKKVEKKEAKVVKKTTKKKSEKK